MTVLANDNFLAIEREYCKRSLSNFVKRAWHVVEPAQPYVHGWHIDVISQHLEAATRGELTRLYIAVPPGHMKSLLVGVFLPAWEWGPAGRPEMRYLGASHNVTLAVRDNLKCRRLVQSEWYQNLWGVELTSDNNAKTKFENSRTGFREAMSFTSMTGSRGDRVLLDDVMSVDDAASDAKRNSIIVTFEEALPTRVNNPDKSAIIIIQQRLHERDLIGVAEAKGLGYEGLVLPMEFEPRNKCVTSIGFKDPRKKAGELLFPERFPREVVDRDKKVMGSYAVASQFQQRPTPREGGMFEKSWFEIVPEAPDNVKWVRAWDLAGSDKASKVGADPAYTAGVLMGLAPDKTLFIKSVVRRQFSAPGKIIKLIRNTASVDPQGVKIDLPQDPGSAGKTWAKHIVTQLIGFDVRYSPETGSKVQRAEPLSAQAEAGNVKLVKGPWNEDFLNEADTFPNGAFKDQIDAASRALARLAKMDTESDSNFAAPIIRPGAS